MATSEAQHGTDRDASGYFNYNSDSPNAANCLKPGPIDRRSLPIQASVARNRTNLNATIIGHEAGGDDAGAEQRRHSAARVHPALGEVHVDADHRDERARRTRSHRRHRRADLAEAHRSEERRVAEIQTVEWPSNKNDTKCVENTRCSAKNRFVPTNMSWNSSA